MFIFGPNFFNLSNYDSSLKEKFRYFFNFFLRKKNYIERPGVISFLLIYILKKTNFKKVEIIPPLRWKKHFSKKILYLIDLIRPTIKIVAQK